MAQPPPRPTVMDPLHITEFASDRYFEKLQQEQNAGRSTADGSSGSSAPLLAQSKFILPLRDSKGAEQDEVVVSHHPEHKKRKAFGLFRLKSSSSTSASTSTLTTTPTPSLAPTSTWTLVEPSLDTRRESLGEIAKPRSLPFDQLFLALPTELQIQIIASLPLSDILNLRVSSKAWHTMITLNEVPITRYHLDNHIPAYAKRLYPVDPSSPPTFHYLCGLWHRLHVAAKLAYFICERVTKEIFLRTTEARKLEFAPQRERMRRRLIPLIFTIFHFFETYREKHVQYLLDNNGVGLRHTPYTLNPIEVEVMNMYDDRTLLQVHQVFPLVVASFCRRLRPPSYAGRVERSLRGYIKDKPADEVHVAALIIGGLRQVEKIWEVKGYNARRHAVDMWYKTVNHEAVVEAPPAAATAKPKRGLMGLGRKKSMAALNQNESLRQSATANAPPLPTNADINLITSGASRLSIESGFSRRGSLIFATSLAAGMPMGPLPREHLRMLLPDLPPLQTLFLTTAEALILDRKIVDRPADIKRNAQVMLDLIREGGMDEEDQWWYGTSASPSIRPPPDATEDDMMD